MDPFPIERAIDVARAQEFARELADVLVDPHAFGSNSSGSNLPARLFLKTPLIVDGQDFASNFRRRVDDKPAELALQLAHRAFMLERARFSRLGQDLFGGDDRFLLLALGDDAGAGPRFVD